MKRIQPLTLVFTLFFPFLSFAQVGFSDAGARSHAMGNASVAQTDVFSAQNNQAALAFIDATGIGLSTQNYFLVEGGIQAHYGVFALPVNNAGTFGLTLNYMGDPTFNQSKIGLGYGRKLSETLAAGIQLDFVGTSTSEAGSGAAFTFDAALLYKPSKTVTIGTKIFNPIRVKSGVDSEQEIPAIINIGFSYNPSENIIVCAEAEQQPDETLRGKFGLEYRIIDELFLRGGYSTWPSMLSCGIGLQFASLQLDLSSQFHQQLGASPSLGLAYSFK